MKRKKKKKYRIKWENLFLLLLIIIFFIGIILSIFKIIFWKIDNNNIKDEISQINDILENTQINNKNENENLTTQPETDSKKDNPYWKYIDTKIENIDFSELKKINKSTIGWLTVKGTNINYPYVQGNDNSFYLNHSFNNKKNQAGWLFLDYRNSKTGFDKNNIIYGHDVINDLIFGSLDKILTDKWQSNPNNHIITIYKEKSTSIWQVFSIYTIPETSDYIQVNFENAIEFEKFINILSKRSIYDFGVETNKEDKILTLSSCYNGDKERLILHAKLVEEIEK